MYRCHAGCTRDAIRAALGLAARTSDECATPRYDVLTPRGRHVATLVRREYPDGRRRYVWLDARGRSGLDHIGVTRLPLLGCDVLRKRPGVRVVIVEGVGPWRALHDLGDLDAVVVATVTGAASCPDRRVLTCLRRRHVTAWSDRDEVGRRHMDLVAERLRGIAASVHRVETGNSDGDDAADLVRGLSTETARAAVAAVLGPVPASSASVRDRLTDLVLRLTATSVPAKEVYRMADAAGLLGCGLPGSRWRQLQRAAGALNVRSKKTAGRRNGEWLWRVHGYEDDETRPTAGPQEGDTLCQEDDAFMGVAEMSGLSPSRAPLKATEGDAFCRLLGRGKIRTPPEAGVVAGAECSNPPSRVPGEDDDDPTPTGWTPELARVVAESRPTA